MGFERIGDFVSLEPSFSYPKGGFKPVFRGEIDLITNYSCILSGLDPRFLFHSFCSKGYLSTCRYIEDGWLSAQTEGHRATNPIKIFWIFVGNLLWSKENAMINNHIVNNQGNAYQAQKSTPKAKAAVVPGQETSPQKDTVSLHNQPIETFTYGAAPASERETPELADLRQMILDTFTDQGLSTRIAIGDTSIDLEDLTPEKARELISEEGYLGVEQTSDRIFEMAISLAGNDPDRLEEIKAGIEKGFEMAADALGGSLPELSDQTRDAVMEKLDAWVEGTGDL